MTGIYIFRFIFCEVFTMAAVLYYMIQVLPNQRKTRSVIALMYLIMTAYCAVMFIFHLDITTNGVYARLILIMGQELLLPWFMIREAKWYRYIGAAAAGDLLSSVIGTTLVVPVYKFLTHGLNAMDLTEYSKMVYYEPGCFKLVVAYVICNGLGYFIVAIVVKSLLKRFNEKIILSIMGVAFIVEYVSLNVIYLMNFAKALYPSTVSTLLLSIVSLLIIMHGMFQERRTNLKEMQMIELQSKIQYEHYLEMEKKQKILRKVRHDLTDHLVTISLLLDQGEVMQAKEYVEKVKKVYQ